MPPVIRSLYEVYPEQAAATLPLGISVDGLLYGVSLDGSDPFSGESPASAEEQIRSALRKLVVLLQGAASDASLIHQISVTHRCPDFASLFDAAWDEVFPATAQPALDEVEGHLPAGCLLQFDCHASLPRSELSGSSIEAIGVCPGEVSAPSGAKVGPIVFGRLTAMHPCTGEIQGNSLESQLRYVLENMQVFLSNAGSGLNDVARTTLYMNPPDLATMNLVWSALYLDPSDRPPHKWVPAALPKGQLAVADVIAIPGAGSRRVIEIESVHHGDPMTMAALTGNVVSSSRVIAPRREDPADYARQIFDNIEEIMALAGGDITNLTQLTAFIGQPEYRLLVEHELTHRLPAGNQRPVVHYVEAHLGGVQAPRIEILGLI